MVKPSNKNIIQICSILSILGLVFIFFTLYRYKKHVEEEFVIEYLNDSSIDPRQNISSQPPEPTKEEKESPTYLDLKGNSPEQIMTYVARTLGGALQKVRPDKLGPPGVIGPKGDQGSSGGLHTDKGMIHSRVDHNLVLDRETLTPKINTINRNLTQGWTHLSPDGKLSNHFNNNAECLNATDKGELEMSRCEISEPWSYVNQQLRAKKPIGGKVMCLTLQNSPAKGKDSQYGIALKECDSGPPDHQAWTWF